MTEKELIEKARKNAAHRYQEGEFLCSEAILYTINELLDQPLPKEIVKLASGLPVGMGEAGCVCGGLSGGVLALGLKFGRTEPKAKCPKVALASKELHDWFKSQQKSTCCRVLIKDYKFGSNAHLQQCTEITGDVAAKTMELIFKYAKMNRLKVFFKDKIK